MAVHPSPGTWSARSRAADSRSGPRRTLTRLLQECGIEIGGPNPWDIQVLNDEFYARVCADGSLGLGESYVDGWWEVRDLEGLIYR